MAAAGLSRCPPTYISTAVMWETEKLRMPEGSGFTADLQNFLGTQIELLRSDKIACLALDRLRGITNATNFPPSLEVTNRSNSTEEVRKQAAIQIPLGKDGQPLRVPLRIRHAPRCSMLLLESRSPDAGFARAYLDALMAAYLDYKVLIRQSLSGGTVASISTQALRLERDLKANQDSLAAFQRTNNLAVISEEAKIAGAYLARLKTQLSDLDLEAVILDAASLDHSAGPRFYSCDNAFTNAALRLESVRPGSSAASISSAELLAAVKELELFKIQRNALSKNLRPKHPKLVKLDENISRDEKLLQMYQIYQCDQIAAASRSVELRSQTVRRSIQDWETKLVDANSRIAEAERLRLNVSRTQSLYDRLVTLLQSVDLSRSLDQASLAVLEPASVAMRSYRWEITVLVAAIVVGLAGGLGFICLAARRDDHLTSISEVSSLFAETIIGLIPESRGLKGGRPLPLLKHNDERHGYAESYRNLRSALLFSPAGRPGTKALLITSAQSGEGKSTIAANLARTLALGGAKVLLVDADLREGRLSELLRLEREPGLSELLEERVAPSRVIQVDTVPNLWFVSRGHRLTDPGDLLVQADLRRVFARWRKRFDHIVIDSSPVLAADDVTALAPQADATLFVVRSGYSRACVMRQALDRLRRRQGRVLGLILNRVGQKEQSYLRDKDPRYQCHLTAKS